MLIQTTFS